jgi:hypothetical protein
MSEHAVFRKCRPAQWALAVLAACLLPPAPLVPGLANKSAAATLGPPQAQALSYRRCDWLPRQEHCYWVKAGTKAMPPR